MTNIHKLVKYEMIIRVNVQKIKQKILRLFMTQQLIFGMFKH